MRIVPVLRTTCITQVLAERMKPMMSYGKLKNNEQKRKSISGSPTAQTSPWHILTPYIIKTLPESTRK